MNVAADHGRFWIRRYVHAGAGIRAGLAVALIVATFRTVAAAEVEVRVEEARGVYHVEGAFSAAVSVATAWSVLADYEHIGAFVSSVRRSRLVAAPDGGRLLLQDAVTGTFPFRRTVHVELALTEDPGRRIAFRDEMGRDFRRYAGDWTVHATAGGTQVGYALEAEPRSGMPALLVRGATAHSACELLTQVRAEMLRRSAAAPR